MGTSLDTEIKNLERIEQYCYTYLDLSMMKKIIVTMVYFMRDFLEGIC